MDVLARRHGRLDVVRVVPLGADGLGDRALATILVTTNLLGDGRGRLLQGRRPRRSRKNT